MTPLVSLPMQAFLTLTNSSPYLRTAVGARQRSNFLIRIVVIKGATQRFDVWKNGRFLSTPHPGHSVELPEAVELRYLDGAHHYRSSGFFRPSPHTSLKLPSWGEVG